MKYFRKDLNLLKQFADLLRHTVDLNRLLRHFRFIELLLEFEEHTLGEGVRLVAFDGETLELVH